MSTQLEGGCRHVGRRNISNVGALYIYIYIYIYTHTHTHICTHTYIYKIFITNKMFIVCTKKSHKIVPITNLNDYEYFKQKLNRDYCTRLY